MSACPTEPAAPVAAPGPPLEPAPTPRPEDSHGHPAIRLPHGRPTKAYAGGKKFFENIRLSFLPGVKIGVVGVNGSGKSSLLRIMAGLDKRLPGRGLGRRGRQRRLPPPGARARPRPHVRGNVMEGVAAKRALLDRYNEVAMQVAEDYSDALMEEMTTLQDQIDAQNLWDLDAQVDVAMEALRCPPTTPPSTPSPAARSAASPSASSSSRPPTSSCSTSPPTTSTPRPSPGCRST